MTKKKRTIGSLTHADFGKIVQVSGYPRGVLWGIEHVDAMGDIPAPWTRLTIKAMTHECTRGLPPETVAWVEDE